MTPDEKMVRLNKIADQIAALNVERTLFESKFEAKLVDLNLQLKVVLGEPKLALAPTPRTKRAYSKRKPSTTKKSVDVTADLEMRA